MPDQIFKDRVLETTSTTGTGTLTLGGAITGYQGFSAWGDGIQGFYSIWDVDANGNPDGDWEVGIGQYTSSGSLLDRMRVLSSSNATGTLPTIEAQSTLASDGSNTTLVTNAPSGLANGKRLLLFVATQDGAGSGNNSITTPSNWTIVAYQKHANGGVAAIYEKIADGNNDTPTITVGVNGAILSRTWIVDNSYDFEAIDTTTETGVDTSVDIPAFTVATDNCLQIALVQCTSNSSISSWPSPLTEISDDTAGGEGCGMGIATTERDIGSVSAGTVTSALSTRHTVITICCRPASHGRVSFAAGTKRVMGCYPGCKASLPDVQSFTTAGTHTWIKPPGCKIVEVILIGGGGGGGSGRKGAAGGLRTGGSGGGGGGIARGRFLASSLGAVETVTVAAAGTGGVSQTVDSNDGTAGTAGGHSIFSNLRAAGGNGGTFGKGSATSVTGAGGTDSIYSQSGNTGGACNSGGNGSNGGTGALLGPTGGGGGGGITAADALGSVGVGGTFSATVIPTAVAGGASGTAGGDGGDGNSIVVLRGLSHGTCGGGGAAAATGQSGAGGNGGNYGAGGGGGAAATDSGDTLTGSGAGGNGASGAAMIISY